MVPEAMNSLPAHPIPGVSYRTEAEAHAHYRDGAWLQLTIGDAARRAARLHQDRPFLTGETSTTTFGEFDAATERLAAALLRQGLAPGDRALFQMGTTPDTAVALVGCFKAGVVPVCTLPQHRELEIGQIGALAAPRAYFVQADFNPRFDLAGFARKMAESLPSRPMLIVAGGTGTLTLAGLLEPAPGAADARAPVPNPSDVGMFQLSGGSTGVPKIIPRMHGEYLAQARDWNERNHLRAADVSLWCLPLIHNAGIITALLPCLLSGRTLVLQPAFREESFLDAIARYRVTDTGSIGPIAGRLLESPHLARYDLTSLRHLWAFNRADDLEARLGARAQCIFGITEGILMCSSPNASPERRHGTVGNPVGRCDEISLRAIDGTAPVPDGELGELCFKGASVLASYYGGTPGDPAQFTADGFFRTGDVVRATWVDGERCFVFEGRLKDNISRGGEKYGAEEVETLLVRHPAVLDARVVAMPDRIYGEKGCAYLIVREGRAAPSLAELGEFLTGLGLAKYKLPERIEAVGEFPLTRVGKVDKAGLRARIAAMLRNEEDR
jgi:non-ribosomal peptide synthetase component E (peptide arylation enzyme)